MAFPGFPPDTVKFLAGLSRHNEKNWFEAHRAQYEDQVLEPAKALVVALARPLQKIDPDIQAVPKVTGSIMRIHRDTRFSSDKSPYKDHLDLWFWTGVEKSWDASGFFFRLTAKTLLLGAGMHNFSPDALARYRAAVLDEKKGAALVGVVTLLRKEGYEVGRATYKKTPRGVPADHPRAEFLKHGGLHAAWEGSIPKELTSPSFVDFVAKRFAAVAPIHAWLRKAAR